MRVLALALLLGSCSTPTPTDVARGAVTGDGLVSTAPDGRWILHLIAPQPAHAEEAIAAVWSFYGRPTSPPRVWFVGQIDLDCGLVPEVGQTVAFTVDGSCVSGVWYDDSEVAEVAWPDPPNEPTLARSALAHELNHGRLAEMNDWSDPDHLDDSWRPGGLVDAARSVIMGF